MDKKKDMSVEEVIEETGKETAEEEATSEQVEEVVDETQEEQPVEEEKEEKKDAKDKKIEELQDKLLRQMAEFDNFRKRTEKEKSAMYEIGARDIIEKILPVVDNFERGLAAIPEEQKQEGFVTGMEMIYKQILTLFESIEVKAIEAIGKEFDPELHNAVMHVEDEEAGENIIVEEFMKGYTYRDSVIRHSMVKVAN